MIVLIILGYILLLLIFMIIAALVIPIKYSISGQRYDNFAIKGEMLWFSNGIKFLFYKEGNKNAVILLKIFGVPVNPVKKNKAGNTKEEKKKDSKDVGRFFSKDFIEQIIKGVKSIFRHLKPEFFHAEGLYGFDDPYHTGIACALINTLMPYSECFSIKLTPVFDEETFRGKFNTRGRVILGVLLFIASRFFLSSPVRKAFKKKR